MSVNIASKPFREIGRDKMYNTWHRVGDGAELIFVLKGSGSIVFKSGVYPLVSGGLYYIARGALHYTLPDRPEEYDRIKMLVGSSPITMDKEISEFLGEKESVFALIPEEKRSGVEEIFSAISGENETLMKNAEALAGTLSLLVMLCRYSAGALDSLGDIMSRVISYINENISEQITIDTLCDVSHTSKYHLCRKFKSQMGITIVDYITNTRIELAKEMLRGEREMPVSDISDACGFANVSYFCAVFKRSTGMSPLGYRKKRMYK